MHNQSPRKHGAGKVQTYLAKRSSMEDDAAFPPVGDHVGDATTAHIPVSGTISASARVFAIGELLEQILINLAKARCLENWAFSLPMRPIKELFVLQRVNQKFALAIRSSTPLRRYMLLEPVTDPPKMEVAAWQSGCGFSRQMEDPLDWLIFELNIAWITKYICPPDIKDVRGVTIYALKSLVWHKYDCWCEERCRYTHVSKDPDELEAFCRPEASWRKIPLFSRTSASRIVVRWRSTRGVGRNFSFYRANNETLGDFFEMYQEQLKLLYGGLPRGKSLRWTILKEGPSRTPNPFLRAWKKCWSCFRGEQDWQSSMKAREWPPMY